MNLGSFVLFSFIFSQCYHWANTVCQKVTLLVNFWKFCQAGERTLDLLFYFHLFSLNFCRWAKAVPIDWHFCGLFKILLGLGSKRWIFCFILIYFLSMLPLSLYHSPQTEILNKIFKILPRLGNEPWIFCFILIYFLSTLPLS
jgi:hypothetical protein